MAVKNHKIIFLYKQTTTDELGQELIRWVDSNHTALASISGVSGRLYYEAAVNQDEETVLFKFRYSSWMKDLNKIDYRIQFNGNIYEIKHLVNVLERNREMEVRGVTIDKVNRT